MDREAYIKDWEDRLEQEFIWEGFKKIANEFDRRKYEGGFSIQYAASTFVFCGGATS